MRTRRGRAGPGNVESTPHRLSNPTAHPNHLSSIKPQRPGHTRTHDSRILAVGAGSTFSEAQVALTSLGPQNGSGREAWREEGPLRHRPGRDPGTQHQRGGVHPRSGSEKHAPRTPSDIWNSACRGGNSRCVHGRPPPPSCLGHRSKAVSVRVWVRLSSKHSEDEDSPNSSVRGHLRPCQHFQKSTNS